MLCVACNFRESMERVNDFKNEIRTVVQNAPIILVATKYDTRADDANAITLQEFEQARLQHGLQSTAETSSKMFMENQNVRQAFAKAIRLAYFYKYPNQEQ